MLKNDLLLKALRQEEVSRPPVWMMRQAGRYLPEYIKLREKYDFFTRVQTPELACAITLQPVDIVGVDAAIIFSDILVIPQAMGMEVLMEEGKGPLLPKTIKTSDDIFKLNVDVTDNLKYVFDALSLTKRELNQRVPLIGFAGAPFTLLCYMVEGKGSKGFEKAKAFCFTQPQLAAQLLQKITDATIQYLIGQAKAGADVVQIFDSWSGLLSPEDFDTFCTPYLAQIADALAPYVPVILFPKGSNYALHKLSRLSGISCLGLDWTIDPQVARTETQNRVALQGNFDPGKLLLQTSEIKKAVHNMIDAFGVKGYIANLGHGITPNVPVEHAKAFVNAVKEYESVTID
ncbi:MAG TPA: uroporphyrinogen decarboxylase [Cyclobacteriaceae bacterium]|nr:uroporphyrinogen decarboxylase [Cyclobacteriaceae bacterium]